MKKLIFATLGFVLFGSSAFAQTSTATYSSDQNWTPAVASQGVRVTLLKSYVKGGLTVEGHRYQFEEDLQTSGLSVGYVRLPVGQLGFTTNLAYLGINETSNGIVRVDGNVGIAVNQILNFKGGLNVSKITGFQDPQFSPAVGVQGGAGLQINRNLGVDLAFVVMRQSHPESSVVMDESGFEFGLHGTF